MSSTLATMETAARQLADEINSDFILTAQWSLWANEGIRELHGVIANAHGDTFFTQLDFSLAAGDRGIWTTSTTPVALPADFMRIRGLDFNPGTSSRETVHRFNFGDRNAIGGSPRYLSGVTRKYYRMVSRQKMKIEPATPPSMPRREKTTPSGAATSTTTKACRGSAKR